MICGAIVAGDELDDIGEAIGVNVYSDVLVVETSAYSVAPICGAKPHSLLPFVLVIKLCVLVDVSCNDGVKRFLLTCNVVVVEDDKSSVVVKSH